MLAPEPSAEAPRIRLPDVEPDDADAVWEELDRIRTSLPRISVIMSAKQTSIVEAKLSASAGPMTHAEALWMIVPIVESLFDDDITFGVAFHAQLMVICGYPGGPEAIALQAAFGRAVGEEQSAKLARLTTQAARAGMTADEYVQHRQEPAVVPRDRLVQLFLGESSNPPSDERLRRAVAVLRRTAALAPETMRALLLSTIAWMLWARGKRAVALAYLAEALRLEPDCVLADGLRLHFRARTPVWLESGGLEPD